MHPIQRLLTLLALVLASMVHVGSAAHAQDGDRIRVSVDCTTMGSTGQARVDEPHDVTVTVKDAGGTPKTIEVHVPDNMTGTAIAELLVEAFEDAGIPGVTNTTYAKPTESEVDRSAKRVLTLPDGYSYVSDFVKKTKEKGEDDGHLSITPEKKKKGSGIAPMDIDWVRVRAIESPNRAYRVLFQLEDDAGNLLFDFDQSFDDQLGVVSGFSALQSALAASGYTSYLTSSFELLVYTGDAATPVMLVRYTVSMTTDHPDWDQVQFVGETREIWKDIEIL